MTEKSKFTREKRMQGNAMVNDIEIPRYYTCILFIVTYLFIGARFHWRITVRCSERRKGNATFGGHAVRSR